MAQLSRNAKKGKGMQIAGLAGAAVLGSALSFGYIAASGDEVLRMGVQEPELVERAEASDEEEHGHEEAGDAAGGPQRVLVHIDGEVVSPGVYAALGDDIRVADIVEMAGGLAEGADTVVINLAAPVQDGQKLHIPAVGEEETPTSIPGAASSQTASQSLIDLNNASAEQLMELPGVGEATAAAIIQDRERYGPFASVEDLMRVSGIGERKLERIRELVYV